MALAELFAIEGYAPPSQAQVVTLTCVDGVRLRAARWRPSARKGPVGSVLVMGGRAEYIERYYETIRELRRRGFHVATFDWRGQGGSDRLARNPRKGHVRRFSDYRLDMDAAFRQLMPKLPRPWFVLAHSMGAALCLEASRRKEFPADRLVALCPMLRLRMVERPGAAKALATALDWAGFGRAFIPVGGETPVSTRPFAGNRLTSDPVRYARNARLASELPQLQIGDPTIRWVHEAFRFMDRIGAPHHALDVRTPTLVLMADEDPIVCPRAVAQFAARLKTGLSLPIRGARHEILNETDSIRADFWAAFDAFIPGEARRGPESEPKPSAVEHVEGEAMDPGVAGGDDAPALPGGTAIPS